MIDMIKKLIEDKIREIGIVEEQSNDFGEECIVLLHKAETHNPSFILNYSGFKKDDSMIIAIRLKKDNEYLDEIPESFDGVEIIVLLN